MDRYLVEGMAMITFMPMTMILLMVAPDLIMLLCLSTQNSPYPS